MTYDPNRFKQVVEHAIDKVEREQRAPVVPILARKLSTTQDQADKVAAKLQRPNLPFLAEHLPSEALRILLEQDTPGKPNDQP